MKHKFGTLWNDPRVFRMNILKIASNLWRPLNCILYDNMELQLTLKNKTGTRANYFQANIPSLYQKKTIYFLGNVIYWCLFKHFINFSTKQSEINKERFFGGARILHLMVLNHANGGKFSPQRYQIVLYVFTASSLRKSLAISDNTHQIYWS